MLVLRSALLDKAVRLRAFVLVQFTVEDSVRVQFNTGWADGVVREVLRGALCVWV